MNRMLTPCLIAVLLSGCAEAATAPIEGASGDPTELGLAPAVTTTTNDSHEMSFQSFVPCANGGAGEWVLISGTVHEVFHVTITAKGRATLVTVVQPQGVSGTGLVTGIEYNAVGVLRDVQQIAVGVQQSTINNFRLIGKGQGGNMSVHENRRSTVHPDGSVTLEHDNFRASCK